MFNLAARAHDTLCAVDSASNSKLVFGSQGRATYVHSFSSSSFAYLPTHFMQRVCPKLFSFCLENIQQLLGRQFSNCGYGAVPAFFPLLPSPLFSFFSFLEIVFGCRVVVIHIRMGGVTSVTLKMMVPSYSSFSLLPCRRICVDISFQHEGQDVPLSKR